MFLPKDRQSYDILADRSSAYPNGYYYAAGISDPVTNADFTHVLALNAKVESHAEAIRQRHSERPFFNPYDAFDSLNTFKDFSISKDDFARLLANHRFYASDGELNTLVDRFDKNKIGRVSYNDFIAEITPHSPRRF